MEETTVLDFGQLTNLATNVAIVALFVWYLRHRDTAANDLLTDGHKVASELKDAFYALKSSIDLWAQKQDHTVEKITTALNDLDGTLERTVPLSPKNELDHSTAKS